MSADVSRRDLAKLAGLVALGAAAGAKAADNKAAENKAADNKAADNETPASADRHAPALFPKDFL